MSFERIQSGLRWLAAQFSCEPAEFWRANQPDGYDLLGGLLSKGYARQQGDRVAVSEQGRRVLADREPEREEVDG